MRGVTYHVVEVPRRGEGPGAVRTLLLLHGFTGSAETWLPFLGAFAAARRVVAVDLLGHGESDAPPDPARYAPREAVLDLLALLDQLHARRADVLGYSMGGRLALHLALAAPERVGALVVESASPGIADPEERQQRRVADEALAAFIESEGIEAFVDRWERQPLWSTQAALPEEARQRLRAQRLRNRPQGLANALRGMGAGAQESLWERLGRLQAPTLVVAGELDAKYAGISREMVRAMPRARLSLVAGCGHAVHLERPEEFERRVLEFLAEVGGEAEGRPP